MTKLKVQNHIQKNFLKTSYLHVFGDLELFKKSDIPAPAQEGGGTPLIWMAHFPKIFKSANSCKKLFMKYAFLM